MRPTIRVRRPPMPFRRALAAVLAAGAIAGSIAGCGSASTPPDEATARRDAPGALDLPATAPAIRGTVTRVADGDSVLPAPIAGAPSAPVSCPPSCASSGRPLRELLVEERPGPLALGGDRSVVTMLAGARVLRRTTAGLEAAGFADLRVGQRVSAWFDGPVAESYPSRARGRVVVIEP